nr:GlsB/YeaQ/YmgE family stress response membrane protein [Saprospiraceae bacterium]
IMGSFIWFIITGAIVGWLAGKIIRGQGFGLLWNILIGICGAFAGSFLFGLLGLETTNWLGNIVSGVVGAIVLLWLITFIRGRR